MTRLICYFTDTPSFGGAERMLLTLMGHLDRRMWEPVLIYHPSPGVDRLVEGARHLAVELWPIQPMPEGLVGAARVPGFARALWSRQPEVFNAFLTWPRACKYGLMAAILARIPAIVATEQLFVEVPFNLPAILQQRLLAAGVGRYVAVSDDLARQLVNTYKLPAHKICVIRNGIDSGLYAGPPRRAGSTPVILTVARLDRQKGLEYLLGAIALLPAVNLLLAGEGPERAALEAHSRALGIHDRVAFLGFRSDIRELLASCDVFVLPSLYEGLPVSVLEALASGVPVVATNIPGTDEIIEDGVTGILVPPANPLALAEAIGSLLEGPDRARHMADVGRARVQNEFSAETMTMKMMALYSAMLACEGSDDAGG